MRYVTKQTINDEENLSFTILYLEIDYELMTLYDAMKSGNAEAIADSKRKLTRLVELLYRQLTT